MQKYGRQDNGAERLTDCQDACLCRRQVVETFQVKAKCNDGAEQYHAEYGAERIECYFAGNGKRIVEAGNEQSAEQHTPAHDVCRRIFCEDFTRLERVEYAAQSGTDTGNQRQRRKDNGGKIAFCNDENGAYDGKQNRDEFKSRRAFMFDDERIKHDENRQQEY